MSPPRVCRPRAAGAGWAPAGGCASDRRLPPTSRARAVRRPRDRPRPSPRPATAHPACRWPSPGRASIGVGDRHAPHRRLARVGVAVLVPVKDFRQAKVRLAAALEPAARAALARHMAANVLAAAEGPPHLRRLRRRRASPTSPGPRAPRCSGDPASGSTGPSPTACARSAAPASPGCSWPTPTCRSPSISRWLARLGELTLVPDRHDDGTNVACVPANSRVHVRLRAGIVPPPRRRGAAPRPGRAGRARAVARLGRRRARRPLPPVAPGGAPIAANEPGQPRLAMSGSGPLTTNLAGAGVGAGHRRPPRRRRVRLRGHAGEVGRGRLRRPPPRAHRRLEGHLGPARRHGRARRAAPGRAARRGQGARRHRRGRVPRPRRRRAGERAGRPRPRSPG